MNTPTYLTIIDQLFTLLDQLLKNYAYNGYRSLAEHLRYPLGLAIVLYFILMGFAIVQGLVRASMGEFIRSAIKLSLIYTFAMRWDAFSYYFMQGITESMGQIGDWLITASPIPLPDFAGTGINGALQSVLIEVTEVGNWVWMKGGFNAWSPLLTALAIWIFGYIALILSVVEILLAKMMLAILFTLAPLFISFTLFKPTQGLFDRWLGAIFGFSLFLVFVPAAIALLLNFMHWTIAKQHLEHAAHLSLVGFVPLMMVSILGSSLIVQVTDYAKAIGNSIISSSGSSLLAGTVGGFIGGSLASLSRVHQSFRRKSSQNPVSQTAQAASGNLSVMEGIRNRFRKQENAPEIETSRKA